MQWIAPIARDDGGTEGFEELFADAIRYQLLPQDNFLEPRDFCLLLDLGLTCDTLPPEDLEQCIQHLRAVAPGLNPSDPHDREQLQYRIAKFFADPGRKYHQKLAALKTATDQQIESLTSALENKDQDATVQAEIIVKLNAEIRSRDIGFATDRMQRSARRLAIMCASVFVIFEALVCLLAYRDGTGSWFHRISPAWPILTGVGLFVLFLSGRIMGRERLSAIGLSPGYFLFNSENPGGSEQ